MTYKLGSAVKAVAENYGKYSRLEGRYTLMPSKITGINIGITNERERWVGILNDASSNMTEWLENANRFVRVFVVTDEAAKHGYRNGDWLRMDYVFPVDSKVKLKPDVRLPYYFNGDKIEDFPKNPDVEVSIHPGDFVYRIKKKSDDEDKFRDLMQHVAPRGPFLMADSVYRDGYIGNYSVEQVMVIGYSISLFQSGETKETVYFFDSKKQVRSINMPEQKFFATKEEAETELEEVKEKVEGYQELINSLRAQW